MEYTENKPPKAPKGYVLIETKANKYGYIYFRYVRQPELPSKYKREKTGGLPVN